MSQQEVRFQIMWNRLISILEEQAMTLIRTAFSTSVREAGDLSAGVFDKQGRMVAQAVTGTPGHVNTMAASVPHFINDIGPERNELAPGDAIVGAAIIIEPQTTTVLGSHHQAVLQSDGSLLITRASNGGQA